MTYDYLKKYDSSVYGGFVDYGHNVFFALDIEEIEEAEKTLGHPFPSELRDFYKNIGYGSLVAPHNRPKDYKLGNTNEILPPMVAAKFSKGELMWEGQSHWMAEYTFELLSPGDIPFFEIGDSSSFLLMKPYSDTPNAVWRYERKVEDSLERFIYNLYYDDPSYYLRSW